MDNIHMYILIVLNVLESKAFMFFYHYYVDCPVQCLLFTCCGRISFTLRSLPYYHMKQIPSQSLNSVVQRAALMRNICNYAILVSLLRCTFTKLSIKFVWIYAAHYTQHEYPPSISSHPQPRPNITPAISWKPCSRNVQVPIQKHVEAIYIPYLTKNNFDFLT